MKKIKSSLICWLCSAAILLCNSSSLAQRTLSNGPTFMQVKIGENSIAAENVNITDALSADNKMVHTASFDITLNDLDATKSILSALQFFSKDKRNLQLVFTKTNANYEVVEEKLYDNTIVQEISIPPLNGASRDILKATIKIRASGVQLLPAGGKNNAMTAIKGRGAVMMSSNYKLTMGTLPAMRTSKISNISIRPGDNQLQNFTIEIAGIDGAAWNQWFLTGAGGIKKEQGTIDLMGPDLKKVIYSIQLADVEIISYSTTSSNQQMARATIGLRSKNITFKF